MVLPFRDILTSGSMILAMSFAKAVVAPALGCLPDTLAAGGGILVRPRRPWRAGDGAQGRARLDLEAMGARNLERARELDWGPIAAATEALYRKS